MCVCVCVCVREREREISRNLTSEVWPVPRLGCCTAEEERCADNIHIDISGGGFL